MTVSESGLAGSPAVSRSARRAALPLRSALATVCLSGTLEDKLAAAAAAGFDGVEIFEPDFLATPLTARDVRGRCADLGLHIDLYQPFRDFDSVHPEEVAASLRRLDRKFDVMAELGTDLLLVCSAVAPTAVRDDGRLVEQLGRLAELAGRRGMRACYEPLAWGTHVSTYRHGWDLVRRVDHPALGVCLDSFHILSRGSDPAGIRDIPGDKIFFLQLADAPHLDMDVLQWSRHYRLFPGQGAFDLPTFVRHVLAAGYRGPLSLEVFNDVFRQADPARAAIDALRSLLVLQEAALRPSDSAPRPSDTARPSETAPPGGRPGSDEVLLAPVPEIDSIAFVELVLDEDAIAAMTGMLTALGFARTGRHRTKPVEIWQCGRARILLNSGTGDTRLHPVGVAALGVATTEPWAAANRAAVLLAPRLERRRGPAEADLPSIEAPDGTEIFFCPDDTGAGGWLADFTPDGTPAGQPGARPALVTAVDHVALTQPFDRFDEATLFFRAMLGLRLQHSSEVAAPFGLVRNRAMVDPAGVLRVCLSVSVLRRGADWHPGVTDPQHVALATDDILATAAALVAAGQPILRIPANYYDDLEARVDLPLRLLSSLREFGILYDRNAGGELLHFYTPIYGGRVFLEVVSRIGDYQAYGESNAPIRMASHRRLRS